LNQAVWQYFSKNKQEEQEKQDKQKKGDARQSKKRTKSK
jgi:hypothetical protein